MRQVFLIGAAFVAVSAAVACSGGGGGGGLTAANCTKTQPAGFPLKPTGLVVNSNTAPDFPGGLLDQNGNPTCLRAYSGKVVLINVAAGWCPPCNAEMPAIEQAQQQFGPQGFVVLQALLDSYVNGGYPDANFLNQWTSEYGITFYLVPDHTAQVYQKYIWLPPTDPNYGAIPISIIVDRDQILRYQQLGEDPSSPLPGGGTIQALVNTPAQLKYN